MADELFSLVEKYTSVESMVESFVESSYLKLMEVMAKKRIKSGFLWYGTFLCVAEGSLFKKKIKKLIYNIKIAVNSLSF